MTEHLSTKAQGFSEQTLGQAIVNTWGPAGAHADVYRTLLAENARLTALEGAAREFLANTERCGVGRQDGRWQVAHGNLKAWLDEPRKIPQDPAREGE